MASKNPIFVDKIQGSLVSFTDADGTTPKIIFTPDTDDGGNLMSIIATSTDTADHVFNVTVGANLIGSVRVPAGAGTDGVVPSVSMLDPVFFNGLQNDGSLLVYAGDVVTVNPIVDITATFKVDITPQSGDY